VAPSPCGGEGWGEGQIKTYELKLRADFNQFYLEDAGANPLTAASPAFWNDRAQRDGLASSPSMMAVGTVRHGNVTVSVSLRESEPEDEIETWDHVVDSALELSSGSLIARSATETPEEAEVIPVQPGIYYARVFYGNLETDDPEAEEGEDYYKIVLWPGQWREPQVVKRFGED
jgi:hypothetical protein